MIKQYISLYSRKHSIRFTLIVPRNYNDEQTKAFYHLIQFLELLNVLDPYETLKALPHCHNGGYKCRDTIST